MTLASRQVWCAALVSLAFGASAPAVVNAQEEGPRAFRHAYHEDLDCTNCHSTGGEHGVPRDWTPEACASCHHDPVRNLTCDACHERRTYVDPRPVAQTLHLSVWDEARTRDLSFDHHLHVRLSCRDCHEGAGLLAPPGCESCHENHHRVGVECSQCHRPPDPGVHGLEVHRSCGGAGCHSEVATRRPMLSRESCLVCHAAQRDHNPGRDCAPCHLVSEGSAAPTMQKPSALHGVPSFPSLYR